MVDKVQKIREEVARIQLYTQSEVLKQVLDYIDEVQKEEIPPKFPLISPKKCMYTKDDFTDEDRKVLCDGCKEECEYAQKEEPAPKILEDMLNAKTPAESLGISAEEHDKIIDLCLYGKEPEMVDVDDLPKEEPVNEDLEEAIDAYLATYFGSEKEKQEWPFLKKMAIYFAEWQHQKDSIPVSEELGEVAKEWLRPQLDKSYANYGEVKMMELTHFDGYAMLDAIEFGANWQKTKDESTTDDLCEYINKLSKQFPEMSFAKLSRIAVRVAKWQREQMMAKAIDGEVLENCDGKVLEYDDSILDEKLSDCKVFDKVKVIVIKEG